MLRNGSACIEKSKHGVGFRFKNSFMKLASERWEKGTTLFRFCASISETFLKRIEKGFYIPKSEAKRVLFEEWGILGNNDFRFLSSPQDDKDLEAPDGRVTFPIRFKQVILIPSQSVFSSESLCFEC